MREGRSKLGSGFVLAGMLVMFFGSIVLCVQIFGFLHDGDWTPLPGTYYFYVSLPENKEALSSLPGEGALRGDRQERLTENQRSADAQQVQNAWRLLRYIPHGLMQDESWWVAPESAQGFHDLLTSVLDTLGMAGSVLALGFIVFLVGLYRH